MHFKGNQLYNNSQHGVRTGRSLELLAHVERLISHKLKLEKTEIYLKKQVVKFTNI